MDKFNNIIKQKVEQFEVPYNEAHWAEMDGKLNTIRATKIKKNIFGSVAAIAILAISSYFMFSTNEKTIKENNTLANENTAEFVKEKNNINEAPKNTTSTINEITNENQVDREALTEESEMMEEETNSINENNIEVKEKTTELATQKPLESAKIMLPNAEFIVYNNRACLGEYVSFESQENNLPVSYTWNFGDGTISHKANPIHTYKESLVYTVTLTLLNRQTGIEYTTIQQDVVTILPLPGISFTYSEDSKKHDDNALKYPNTYFNVKNADKKSTYQWFFGNGENSKSAKTKTVYKDKGTFVVQLIATNSYGCENSTKKRVIIKNAATLYTPNAFTPNGDGDNDNFIPVSLLEWDIQFEMTILNKSGKIIYKTSDKNEPWNGKTNNTGKLLDAGVYLWQVITYDADGIPHHHNGNITVL